MIVVLAGGVGAARFLQGLVQVVPQNDITVICNTGDDREFYGLHVSPDLDIITYTLAGVVDETHGWGIQLDTYYTMSQPAPLPGIYGQTSLRRRSAGCHICWC